MPKFGGGEWKERRKQKKEFSEATVNRYIGGGRDRGLEISQGCKVVSPSHRVSENSRNFVYLLCLQDKEMCTLYTVT